MSDTHAHPKHHHQQLVSPPDKIDGWHTHTTDEPMPQPAHGEDTQGSRIFIIGTLGFLIIVVSVVATILYWNAYTTTAEYERVEMVDVHSEAIKQRDGLLAQLKQPVQYVKDANYIHVPQDEAIKKVLTKYAR